MARTKGPRKVQRYTAEFKVKAVRLSELAGVQVQDVADALDVHPFMLSRWRRQVREGRLRARVGVSMPVRKRDEMKQLSALKRKYALLREEHELLKKPSGSVPFEGSSFRLRTGGAGPVWRKGVMPTLRGDAIRVLRVVSPQAQ